MTMPLIQFGIYVAMCLISTILFIVVLIKLFKNEGAFKGILGFIFGIYTFVWGWLKHKELKLTKIMIVWTAMMVLSIVQISVFGAAQFMALVGDVQGERRVETKKMDFKKARAAKNKKAPPKDPFQQCRVKTWIGIKKPRFSGKTVNIQNPTRP